MVEGGRTPLLSPQELHDLGFDLIVTPLAALMAAAKSIREIYDVLKTQGTLRDHTDRLMGFEEFQKTVVEVERHYEIEKRYK